MLTGGSVVSVPLADPDDGVVMSGRYEADAPSLSELSTVIFIEMRFEGPPSIAESWSTSPSAESCAENRRGSSITSVNIAVFLFDQGQKSDLSYV